MKKLFGLGGASPAPIQPTPEIKREIDTHKHAIAIEKMEGYIAASDQKIEKLNKENALIRDKMVELLKVGKKDMAKRLLLKKKKNEQLVESINKRTLAMQGFLMNMEAMKDNQDFAQAMATSLT